MPIIESLTPEFTRRSITKPLAAIAAAGGRLSRDGIAIPAHANNLNAPEGFEYAFYRPDNKGVWYAMFPGVAGVRNPIDMDAPDGPLETCDARMLAEFGRDAFDGMIPNSLGHYKFVMKAENDDPRYRRYAGFCAASVRQSIYDNPFEGDTYFTDSSGRRRIINEIKWKAEGAMRYSGQHAEELTIAEAAAYIAKSRFPVSVDMSGNEVWQFPAWGVSADYQVNPNPRMVIVRNGLNEIVNMKAASAIWRIPVVYDGNGVARPTSIYDMTDEQILGNAEKGIEAKGYWINPWSWPEYHEHNRVPGSPKPTDADLKLFLGWRRRLKVLFQERFNPPVPWL